MGTQNTYRNIINNAYKETESRNIKTEKNIKNNKEIVYRKNGKSVEKIIEFLFYFYLTNKQQKIQ